jgi:Uncharacterized protein conserved in bacteria C-term(DUF2220)
LYVEKGTERTKFEQDRIAEKYDMAIIYGSGYATEAIHELLETAEEGEYQLFIWHDADVDGYNIVRNLREETENIPGFVIDIIDIGLHVEEALRIGCASEPFTDNDALPRKLEPLLNDAELEYFGERQIRFEINGINPPTYRMGYVEEQLQKHGIRPKYVPPEEALEKLLEDELAFAVRDRVSRIIDRYLDRDAIVQMVLDELRDELRIEDPEAAIRQRFEQAPTQSWDDKIGNIHRPKIHKEIERIEEVVRDAVITRVTRDTDS